APRAASARAIAWPIPPLAPVSRTVVPRISVMGRERATHGCTTPPGRDDRAAARARDGDGDGRPRRAILAAMAVIAIFGPTGIGKTAVAVALARRLRADGE